MAKAKSDGGTVRLTHVNGATVLVPSAKKDRLVASGSFAEPTEPAAEPTEPEKPAAKSGK